MPYDQIRLKESVDCQERLKDLPHLAVPRSSLNLAPVFRSTRRPDRRYSRSRRQNGDNRPVLLDVTERLEFVDAPMHADDVMRYRACGYAMRGNRIRVVTDRPM
jgi:sensor c-di-GMP phosphodiesterase-like protein